MAKSSGLAVLALLFAIGALGIGIYQMIFAVPAETPAEDGSGVKNTWYNFHYSTEYTNPTSTIIPIEELTINFTISPGESVYFHFNTWAEVVTGPNKLIQFEFMLDGVRLSGPTYPWWLFRTDGARIEAPLSCQLSLDTVTAGAHNVTISIFGNDINNNIQASTLFVQTYVP